MIVPIAYRHALLLVVVHLLEPIHSINPAAIEVHWWARWQHRILTRSCESPLSKLSGVACHYAHSIKDPRDAPDVRLCTARLLARTSCSFRSHLTPSHDERPAPLLSQVGFSL